MQCTEVFASSISDEEKTVDRLIDVIKLPDDLKSLDFDELEQLADDIRCELIRTVPATGGHLASNLGAVELTIALHYVLDLPNDKIVWDVGHQAYTHKILSGRLDKMDSLRKFGGMSGFPKPQESEYDAFGTGHSSTAISAALGIAVAEKLNNSGNRAVAVVGDGSMTGGLSFEGLNNCVQANVPMMIVLNDNGMSISQNVGALNSYLAKTRSSKRYNITKVHVKNRLNRIPVIGKPLFYVLDKIKDLARALFVPDVWFEDLGIKYIGIVDGHDIKKLVKIFDKAKDFDAPVLIHVKTKKGKGNTIVENNPAEFHSVSENSSIKAAAEKQVDEEYKPTSFSLQFGKKLSELAAKNNDITAITAAMEDGTGLTEFARKYPDRFFDVGIAEQHAVTFAAGLAIQGKKPFFAVYSSFLQRAYDQVIHDVCIQNLPVTFCIDRAGISGRDGETHNGQFDIAFLSHIPNMTLFAPSTMDELNTALEYASIAKTPVAIRYGKAKPSHHEAEVDDIFRWKATDITNKARAVVFATGSMVQRALEAKQILAEYNVNIIVVNAMVLKPMDEEMLYAMRNIKLWITAEDGTVTGGFGSAVGAYAAKACPNVKVKNMGIPDEFIPHGSIDEIYGFCGMTSEAICQAIWEEL